MSNLENSLKNKISKLKEQDLFRSLSVHDSSLVNFSSNDYLGLAARTQAVHGGGSTGSRLTTGTAVEHIELEAFIADWKGTEAALVFSSGYLANIGAIQALVGPRDIVFSDELNHACILDGIKLSGAKKFFYRHNDIDHLEELLTKYRDNYDNALIITDTVFSMDGDRARLAEIVPLAQGHSASIYVDEAHACGILGSSGAGLVEELVDSGMISKGNIEIQMGTFSKAVGLEGAYITGSRALIEFLQNNARSFMFQTACPPSLAAQILEHLKIIRDDSSLRQKLQDNIKYFRELLEKSGLDNWINEKTAIFSFEFPDIESCLAASQALKADGFLVLAIRPPTVPSPRLRVCLSAVHSFDEIKNLFKSLQSKTPNGLPELLIKK